jgi:hypothetical protein
MFVPHYTTFVVLVALLGHPKFSVREGAYAALSRAVVHYDYLPDRLWRGMRSSDPTVKEYCERLHARFFDVLPEGQQYPLLYYMPRNGDEFRTVHGSVQAWYGKQISNFVKQGQHPKFSAVENHYNRLASKEFARLLLTSRGFPRSEVVEIVRHARELEEADLGPPAPGR